MKKQILLSIASLLLFVFCGGQNLEKSWRKVLKSCSKSEIVGKQTLFFGPSNTIGLGSVWRKTDSRGYNPRFELADLITDPTERAKIIKLGEKATQCDANKTTAWDIKLGLPFLGPIFSLTGVDAGFSQAKRVTVSVDNIALDVLKEVQFEQSLRNLASHDPQNAFLTDLLQHDDRLLVTKAYRITGMIVKMDFDPKQLEDLKAKYASNGTLNIGGEKGLTIGINFSNNQQITLKLPSEVYVAGEFSKVKNGSINLNDAKNIKVQLVPIKIDTTATVGKIEPLASK